MALLAAFLVWGSGLDRLSRSTPRIANAVPEPLRSYAWRVASAQALESRRAELALQHASRGVLADPMDAGAVSTLGIARLAASDPRGAGEAFRVAASLGWRDRPTQLYWLSVALSGGFYDLAAQRLDAILRQRANLPQADALLAPFEQTPEGRRSLAAVLALKPGWLPTYLAPRDEVSEAQLAARSRVLQEPAIAAAGLSCDDVSKFVAHLSQKELAAEGKSLWEAYCGSRSGLIQDGGFERARLTATSPLEWQFPGEGGLNVRLGALHGGQALLIESGASSTRVFAVQGLQLPPGPYAISWTALDAAGEPTNRIRARLTCRRGDGNYLEARRGDRDRFVAEARVDESCSLQWLELAIAPGAGAVSVDNIAVSPRPR